MSDLKKYSLFKGIEKREGLYKNKKTDIEFTYIKQSCMKETFPAGGYSVVGQLKKGDEQIGSICVSGKEEPVYKVQKKPMTRVVGFVQVGENEFVSIVQSTWAILILSLLLALLICVGAGFLIKSLLPQKTPEAPTTTKPPIIIDAGAEEGEGKLEIPEKIDTKGQNIKVNGVPEIHLKADQLEQNFPFANPKENPCFFEIQILMKDNIICSSCGEKVNEVTDKCPKCGKSGTVGYEVIYTSDLIPPGYAVSNFKLERGLPEGKYDVIIRYNTFTFDQERRPLNNMVINTTIISEKK